MFEKTQQNVAKTQQNVAKLNKISKKLNKISKKLKLTGKSICSDLRNCSEKISLVYMYLNTLIIFEKKTIY